MTGLILGATTTAVVLWAAFLTQRDHRRLPGAGASAAATGHSGAATGRSGAGNRLPTALGNRVLRLLQRLPVIASITPPRELAAGLGTALLLAPPLFVVSKSMAILAIAAAVGWPWWAKYQAAERRRRRIERELPLVVDLFRVGIGSGLNITMATAAVGRYSSGLLAGELQRAVDETRHGRRMADALEQVANRTCQAVRPLVAALAAGERYGAPLSVVLERLAHDTRVDQERRADHAAKRLAVHLLFPVAGCTLPAFALLTVAPLIAGSFGSLATSFH